MGKVILGNILNLTPDDLPPYDAVATDPPWGQGKTTYFANLANAAPMRFAQLIRALASLAQGKLTMVLMGEKWVSDTLDIFNRPESVTITCRYGQRPCTLIAFAPAWVPPLESDVPWREAMTAGLRHLNMGSTVLDPLCGRGSIGSLCDKIGLKYIGVELNPERIA